MRSLRKNFHETKLKRIGRNKRRKTNLITIMVLYTNNDARFLSIAIEEAHKSILRAKLGCVAVVSGKVVARGYNNYQTYSKDGLIKRVCSCHAEIAVLRKCLRWNINGKINLYIMRVKCDGEVACSAPCMQCTEVMRDFNIKNITYIAENGNTIKTKFKEYNTTYKSSGEIAILRNRVKCI